MVSTTSGRVTVNSGTPSMLQTWQSIHSMTRLVSSINGELRTMRWGIGLMSAAVTGFLILTGLCVLVCQTLERLKFTQSFRACSLSIQALVLACTLWVGMSWHHTVPIPRGWAWSCTAEGEEFALVFRDKRGGWLMLPEGRGYMHLHDNIFHRVHRVWMEIMNGRAVIGLDLPMTRN